MDNLSDFYNKIDSIVDDESISIVEKSKEMIRLDSELNMELNKFCNSKTYTSLNDWENWIYDYLTFQKNVDDILEYMKECTERITGVSIKEDTIFELLDKLLLSKGFTNSNKIYSKDSLSFDLNNGITDTLVDNIISKI